MADIHESTRVHSGYTTTIDKVTTDQPFERPGLNIKELRLFAPDDGTDQWKLAITVKDKINGDGHYFVGRVLKVSDLGYETALALYRGENDDSRDSE